MTETEKNITRKLSEAVNTLPKEEQKYMLGLAEGFALGKNTKPDSNKKRTPRLETD